MHHQKSCLKRHSKIIIPILINLFIPRNSSSQLEWNAIPNPFADKTLLSITFCNGNFIAINDNLIAYSTDGISWNVKEINFQCPFGKTAYGNNTYFGSCINGEVWTSTDLLTFSHADTIVEKAGSPTMAVFGNKAFIAAGCSNNSQTDETFSGWSLVSTDSDSWTKHPIGSYNSVFLDAVYRNDRFVAVGGRYTDKGMKGITMTSPDGISWTRGTIETPDSVNDLWAIASGNNRFVAVGYFCESIVSNDGINWSNITINKECSLTGVSYGNGYFITGGGSCLYYSTDAETWKKIPLAEEMDVNGVAFGNDRFVVNCNRKYFFVSDPIASTNKDFHAVRQNKPSSAISLQDNILRLTLPPGSVNTRPELLCVDNLGRALSLPFHTATDGKLYADMNPLPAGMYLLWVNTGSTVLKRRFVKMH